MQVPEGARPLTNGYAERVAGLTDEALCCAFLEDVRGHTESDQERALLVSALENGRLAEASA